MRKIKAFTLAETLVTLTIIGVIMSLIIPVAFNSVAGTEGLLFKKAMVDLHNAADQALDELEINNPYGVDTRYYLLQLKPKDLCEAISQQLSTVGTVSCSASAETPDAGSASFLLANGIAFWNVGGTGANSFYNDVTPCTTSSYNRNCVRTIWIDVDGSHRGKNLHGKDRFKMLLKYNGQVTIGTGEDWQIEEEAIKNGRY